MKLADGQEAIGNLFNPFILFSLGWSIFILCLTIYFVTQMNYDLNELFATVPESEKYYLERAVYFSLGWSFHHVVIGICYIKTICSTGTATNEMVQ